MSDDAFMAAALAVGERARAGGNMPVGAVVVCDGRIVGEGPNLVLTETDPSAHAEIVAIRRAARALGQVDLSACTLYTTVEPCAMCTWSIVVARIPRLVVGVRHEAIGRPDMGRYSVEGLLDLTGRSLELVTGVRAAECEAAFGPWFREKGLDFFGFRR